MPLYFIIHQNGQLGPLDQEELKGIQLEADTLVWRYGFAGWREAGTIEELAKFLPPQKELVIPKEVSESVEEVLLETETLETSSHRYGQFLTAILLLFGVFLPSQTNTDSGVVIFIGLAIGAWWSLQQYFLADDDIVTARIIWMVILVHVLYLLAYLGMTGLPASHPIPETVWQIGWCRTLGNCTPDEELFAQRLSMYFQQIKMGYLLAVLALFFAAIRFWKMSALYGSLLSWLAWGILVAIPLWMFVHLMDRLLGADSMGWFSSLVLLAPYGLIVLFLNEIDSEDA